MIDYVIIDRTSVHWPGRLPFRSIDSRRGYPTREDAMARLREVERHYHAKHGCSPGRLEVVERGTP